MGKIKQYIFNKETLSYEVVKTSLVAKLARVVAVFLCGLAIFAGYYWLYTGLLYKKSPKTALLEKRNRELTARIAHIDQKLAEASEVLAELQMRDNILYRPVFGMQEIPSDVRNAGFGGVDRYSHLAGFENSKMLISSARHLDILTKKACVQSKSFDDVAALSKRAGEMASCIPSIPPVEPCARNRYTSSFGYRVDPFTGIPKFHSGIDIAGKAGEPVHSSGNGTVCEVSFNFFGYGNMVTIDHGFGYKSRYAHLKSVSVVEGQRIMRGDQIGAMGNTGRSTAVHLHYEVLYQDKFLNPWNYLTGDLTSAEYKAMVKKTDSRRGQ